jgi:hypothetical protein
MESAKPKEIRYDLIVHQPQIFHHVANDINTYKFWQKLDSMYESKTTINKASVIKQLVKLEYLQEQNTTIRICLCATKRQIGKQHGYGCNGDLAKISLLIYSKKN